jgi:hypothetical protein
MDPAPEPHVPRGSMSVAGEVAAEFGDLAALQERVG